MGLCLLKAGRESPHWASARGLSSVCDAADAANASIAPAEGPQQPHLQHGAAVSANDATGLRFSYLSAFARGSPVDTHDVIRPCPCGTRRPEHFSAEIVIDSSRSQSRRHETTHAFPVTTTVSKAPGIITDRARPPDENAYKA